MALHEFSQPPLPFFHKRILNTALLLALIGIVIALIPSLMGETQNKIISSVFTIINIAITVFFVTGALVKYRDEELGGYISLGRAFQFGFYIMIIVAVISAIFSYVQFTLIDPNMLSEMTDMQMAEMEKRGMSDDQMEMASKVTGMFSSPLALSVFALFGGIFWGALISIIIAAIKKKWPPPVNIPTTTTYNEPFADKDQADRF